MHIHILYIHKKIRLRTTTNDCEVNFSAPSGSLQVFNFSTAPGSKTFSSMEMHLPVALSTIWEKLFTSAAMKKVLGSEYVQSTSLRTPR